MSKWHSADENPTKCLVRGEGKSKAITSATENIISLNVEVAELVDAYDSGSYG